MKARILKEIVYAPQLKKEEIVEIVPGMETDAEGIWNAPAGKLFLCKKEDGTFSYTMPSLIQLLPEENGVDWSAFRRDASKEILCSVLIGGIAAGAHGCVDEKEVIVASAIEMAEELIKQLKSTEHGTTENA